MSANRIRKGNVRHNPVTEKCIYTMTSAIEKLVWNDKLEGLVVFLKRTDGGDGDYTLCTQLLEGVNISAKVQLTRKNAVSAPMPRQECNLAPFERTQNKGIRGIAKGSVQADFLRIAQSRHG